MKRALTAAFVVSVAVAGLSRAASAGPPVALPLAAGSPAPADSSPPGPLPLPVECGIDDAMNSSEAVGRAIDDETSLRFIDAVGDLSAKELRAIAASPSDAALSVRVRDLANAACTGALASTIAGRAFIIALTRANIDLPGTDSGLLGRLNDAGAALATRDRVSASDLAATLAPFGLRPAAIAPEPPFPVTCSDPDARAKTTRKIDPVFPALAAAKHEFGIVQVLVHLGEHSFPTYTVSYRAPATASDDSLTEASIIAAAASQYQTGRAKCHPIAHSYLFVSTYDAGK